LPSKFLFLLIDWSPVNCFFLPCICGLMQLSIYVDRECHVGDIRTSGLARCWCVHQHQDTHQWRVGPAGVPPR
jgi:hypothetical protein